MVARDVEQVGSRHLEQGRVEELLLEGRLGHGQGRLKQAEVAETRAPPIAAELVRVDAEHLV
jgi:hypothetical protein